MAWLKCPYSRCRYSWESKTDAQLGEADAPKRCPKCTGRLDTPSRWQRPAPKAPAPPAVAPSEES